MIVAGAAGDDVVAAEAVDRVGAGGAVQHLGEIAEIERGEARIVIGQARVGVGTGAVGIVAGVEVDDVVGGDVAQQAVGDDMVDRLAAAVERIGVALGLGQGEGEIVEAGAADAGGAVGHACSR